jgi:hypothetical protein
MQNGAHSSKRCIRKSCDALFEQSVSSTVIQGGMVDHSEQVLYFLHTKLRRCLLSEILAFKCFSKWFV